VDGMEWAASLRCVCVCEIVIIMKGKEGDFTY
jgi:hypothetical protein